MDSALAVPTSGVLNGGYWHYPIYFDDMGNPVSAPDVGAGMRYDIAATRMESLGDINQRANYDNVFYTFEGNAIFANKLAKCDVIPFEMRA